MNLGGKPMSIMSSSSSWKSGNGVSDQFPVGLRVLVVDDDPTCLRILEKMLRNCLYEVTKCNRAEIALQYLRDNRNGFDVVLSDVHMPDMDGFKLLEHIGLEMDLPVIMMSADDSQNVVMKGVTHGACDYLIKPVRMEALKNIWQHVVRKKKHEWREKDLEHSGSAGDGEMPHKVPEDVDYSSSLNEGNWKSTNKKRKDEEVDVDDRDDTSALKKPRVVWSVELHQQFVTAVNQLGIDKAVPKKILELMNVPGLTRENVASHLQKYRLYLRRLSGVSPHANGLDNSFLGTTDAFGAISSLNSLDLQALAASGQLTQHSLAAMQATSIGRVATKSVPLGDQRNIFSFENPNLSFAEGKPQQNNSAKQGSLLHGIPTNMDSKQLATLHQSAQAFGNMNMHIHSPASQNKALLTQMVQPQARSQLLNEINSNHVLELAIPHSLLGQNRTKTLLGPATYSSVSDHSTVVDFSRCLRTEMSVNSFAPMSNSVMSSLTSKGMVHDEVNSESKGSRSTFPTYDIFNDRNLCRNQDWGLPSVGSTFEVTRTPNLQTGLEISSSVLVQPGFSSNQKSEQNKLQSVNKTAFLVPGLCNSSNITHQFNSSITDNLLRFKAERLPDMGFQNSQYPEHFSQDDLMSLYKQQQEVPGPMENVFGFDEYNLDNLHI